MKILAIAYGCEPNHGSEQGVGWNWVNNFAKLEDCELTVITRANNKSSIEAYNKKNNLRKINYCYYDLPKNILRFKKKDKKLILFFTLWQLGVIKYIKKNININDFDYVWELNFGSLVMPTFVYKLKHPFFIGPIWTKKGIQKQYLKKYPFKEKMKYFFQQFIREHIYINIITWKALKKSNKIITCDEMTRFSLPKRKVKDSIAVLHNGINKEDFNQELGDVQSKERISFICACRLVKHKNLDTAINALEQVKLKGYNFIFDIVGDGPEKKNLKKLVESKGLEKNIIFHEKMTQKELFNLYSSRDCFLYTSLQDISATSVMEAMYCGLVPICFDISGMEYITKCKSVIKIPIVSPEQDINTITQKIIQIMENKKELAKLKKDCYTYAQEYFLWENKINDIKKVWDFIKND